MGAPHVWLKGAIEAAAAPVLAWPVEMTGKGDPPYAVYVRGGTTRDPVLADELEAQPQPDELPPVARFLVVVYAPSYVQAWEISDAIVGEIHRFKGTAFGETIDSCFVVDERDGEAEYLDGAETPTYTVELDVEIRYSE
jgi:hypothetical protein